VEDQIVTEPVLHAATFHRNAGVAMRIEAPVQPVRGVGQSRGGIAFFDDEFADQVGLVLVMYNCGSRLEGISGIDNRRQRFQIDRHQFGAILRLALALRHDHGNCLAYMPYLVQGQQRLLGQVDCVPHLGAPLARERQLRARNRGRDPQKVGAGKHLYDARHRRSARDIDRPDAGMRDLAPDKDRMQHLRQREVRDELSLPGQQAPILAPRHRASNETGRFIFGHRLGQQRVGSRMPSICAHAEPAWRCVMRYTNTGQRLCHSLLPPTLGTFPRVQLPSLPVGSASL
jgi:hypothetical protein